MNVVGVQLQVSITRSYNWTAVIGHQCDRSPIKRSTKRTAQDQSESRILPRNDYKVNLTFTDSPIVAVKMSNDHLGIIKIIKCFGGATLFR